MSSGKYIPPHLRRSISSVHQQSGTLTSPPRIQKEVSPSTVNSNASKASASDFYELPLHPDIGADGVDVASVFYSNINSQDGGVLSTIFSSRNTDISLRYVVRKRDEEVTDPYTFDNDIIIGAYSLFVDCFDDEVLHNIRRLSIFSIHTGSWRDMQLVHFHGIMDINEIRMACIQAGDNLEKSRKGSALGYMSSFVSTSVGFHSGCVNTGMDLKVVVSKVLGTDSNYFTIRNESDKMSFDLITKKTESTVTWFPFHGASNQRFLFECNNDSLTSDGSYFLCIYDSSECEMINIGQISCRISKVIYYIDAREQCLSASTRYSETKWGLLPTVSKKSPRNTLLNYYFPSKRLRVPIRSENEAIFPKSTYFLHDLRNIDSIISKPDVKRNLFISLMIPPHVGILEHSFLPLLAFKYIKRALVSDAEDLSNVFKVISFEEKVQAVAADSELSNEISFADKIQSILPVMTQIVKEFHLDSHMVLYCHERAHVAITSFSISDDNWNSSYDIIGYIAMSPMQYLTHYSGDIVEWKRRYRVHGDRAFLS